MHFDSTAWATTAWKIVVCAQGDDSATAMTVLTAYEHHSET
ncbi:MAG TPA: hypothetical protein VFH31_02920 [Pyrinomonadaceae bacterium]|nr:hypothetical protein [Pyrinomonadaceae bacterium]